MEYCRTGDNCISACRDGQCGVFAVLPTIDFYPRVESLRGAKSAQVTNFRQHFRQKFLPAESGINCHHQNDSAKREYVLDKRRGNGGVEHDAGLFAQLLYVR